jgi:hypothetical protein
MPFRQEVSRLPVRQPTARNRRGSFCLRQVLLLALALAAYPVGIVAVDDAYAEEVLSENLSAETVNEGDPLRLRVGTRRTMPRVCDPLSVSLPRPTPSPRLGRLWVRVLDLARTRTGSTHPPRAESLDPDPSFIAPTI